MNASGLLRRLLLAGMLAAIAALALARFVTDWLWFASLGYGVLFTVPLAWQAGIFLAVTVLTFGVLWANVLAARPALARAYLRLPTPRLAGSWPRVRRWVAGGLAIVSALWGASVAASWPVVALWVHREPFGVADPLFGRDVGFYVFELPAYRLALQVASAGLLVSTGLAGLIYASAGMLAWGRAGAFAHGRVRTHLLLLAAGILAALAISTWLSRYELLFSPGGIVYGATYADVHVRLPVRAAVAGLTLLAAVLTLAAAASRQAWPAVASGALALGVAVGGELVAGAVQRLVVRPNELARERPFIARHIEFTRRAYGLDALQEASFEVEPILGPAQLQAAGELLANVRLWDWRPMGSTLSQLQVFRPYYDFVDVDVDRYRVDGRMRQVMVAARELNASRLQNPSWVNLRLQYTHGYGVVMSPASEVTPAGLPRLVVRDIPPRSDPGWPQVRRPAIYFGQAAADWVVVNTRAGEFDYPSGEENVFTRYEGKDGVSVAPLWARLLFAARLRSLELLLSREITANSRVLLYRTVAERLERLFPYVRYDPDPYVVVTEDGRLVWMADAYTLTDRYPYARPVSGWGNYVRNAIKATVDAYDGTVRFYLFDETDPLARALSRLFHGFLAPASAMPEDLRAHVRYPEQLFMVQARVLSVYHMTAPDVFYNQEDRWDLPRELYGESEVPMQAYYAMADLGAGEPEFALLLPFTAAGRQNMVAWMAARMDPGRYGQLVLFRFPKQVLTYGPMQVEARINQDPEISRELTLWGQRGSRVLRGNLIVVPVGRTLLYVEPLFLVSEQSQLPELRRVVAATGPELVMAPTLEEALTNLVERARGAAAPVQGIPPAVPPAPLAPAAGTTRSASAREVAERALARLEQARQRLQQGDWEGFGRLMQEVEQTLRALSGAGEAAPGAPSGRSPQPTPPVLASPPAAPGAAEARP